MWYKHCTNTALAPVAGRRAREREGYVVLIDEEGEGGGGVRLLFEEDEDEEEEGRSSFKQGWIGGGLPVPLPLG